MPPAAAIRPALVVNHLKGGGKEQFVVALANQLAERGHAPLVVCFERGGRLGGKLCAEVSLVELGKAGGSSVRTLFRLARTLRAERATLVHSNNWGTLVECVVAGRLAGGLPVVHTQHGLDYERGTERRPSTVRLATKRLMARGLRALVAVSDEVRTMLVDEWRVAPDRVHVVTNGVAIPDLGARDDAARCRARRAIGLPADAFVVGTVGYLRPVKDYPTLVRAFARVRHSRPEAHLVVVGDGPSRPEIEATIRALGLGGAVHLLGVRGDVPALLPLFDVFALSSLSEGISLAILEAMGWALPVVATRVGGNPQVVAHGCTGLLVPPSDAEAFGDALRRLADEPATAEAFGRAGRGRMVEQFSAARMGSDYERIYHLVESSYRA